jgi:hypothetical protein
LQAKIKRRNVNKIDGNILSLMLICNPVPGKITLCITKTGDWSKNN